MRSRKDALNRRYQIYGSIVFDSIMRCLLAGRARIPVWVQYERQRHARIMRFVNDMLSSMP